MKFKVLLFLFGLISVFPSVNLKAQRFFETETVEEADFTVAAVFELDACDLKVCFVYEEADAKEPGKWMEVPEVSQADIKIIFVDDPALADIKLFIVDACSDAGWHKTGKEDMLTFK